MEFTSKETATTLKRRVPESLLYGHLRKIREEIFQAF